MSNMINLASKKQVVASSIESSAYIANNAIDGQSTRWSSESFSKGAQWIYIDLGQTTLFDTIKIIWYSSYATIYRIEVSNDATTWTSAYRTTTGAGRIETITLSIKQNARYVRVYGEQPNVNPNNNMSIYEIEIYDKGVGATPTIPVKPITTPITSTTTPVTSTIPVKPITTPVTSTIPTSTLIKTPPILSYTINKTFNGSSDYLDITKDLSKVQSLTAGAIVVKFKATSTSPSQSIFSVSDTKDANTKLIVMLNTGRVRYEVRKGTTQLFGFNMAPIVNDGKDHTALISVGKRGLEGYIDGVNIFTVPKSYDFFASLASKNSMNIGRNLNNIAAGQWYFKGTIQYVDIYNYELTAVQAKAISINSYK